MSQEIEVFIDHAAVELSKKGKGMSLRNKIVAGSIATAVLVATTAVAVLKTNQSNDTNE